LTIPDAGNFAQKWDFGVKGVGLTMIMDKGRYTLR
jgi:hypothetical protein